MDSRELIIIDPIVIEGELEQNPIVEKINTIINYINQNRFRQQEVQDHEYLKEHPQATMATDIKLRETISRNLGNQDNMNGILTEVREKLNGNCDAEESERRFAIFLEITGNFFQHLKFIHLTAVELAIVAMMVDTLIILLYKAQAGLKDDDALICVTNKQNELLRVREGIKACMQYHAAIFEANSEKKTTQNFYYSDILINLFEAIEKETGTQLVNERKDLWPDMSYLQALPEVPFYKQEEPQNVRQFFATFVESSPPADTDVDKLVNEFRYELDLLDDDVSPIPVSISSDSDSASTGCFGWFGSRPATKVKPPQIVLDDDDLLDDADEAHAPLTEAERHDLDDMIRLMSSFNERAQKQIDEIKFFEDLKKETMALQQTLAEEIAELQEPRCCSFFWTGTLRKKLSKESALRYVLEASTPQELADRANEKLTGDDKGLVCAGIRSRTEAMLNHIANVVQIRYPIVPSAFDLDLL